LVVRVRAGDTIVCPPDEDHRHGAAGETLMSHFAVLLENLPDGADPTTWLEPVTDEGDGRTSPPGRAHARAGPVG
jgi:quercetin dioxygenase-like cupin family protein